MDTIQAILLGIVQGITEFLPVSSSGHLQIAKELLGVQLEENLTFDVTLHAATVLSTIVVLWSEIRRLLQGLFSRRFNEEQAYILKLILSMIPIGIVGFLFKDQLDALLNAPYILLVVGAMLLLTAALLAFAQYARPRQKERISYRDALLIGVAQACAAMPGLSRSGSTIATGILLGNKKTAVAQFSFLMVLAPILGETLLVAQTFRPVDIEIVLVLHGDVHVQRGTKRYLVADARSEGEDGGEGQGRSIHYIIYILHLHHL